MSNNAPVPGYSDTWSQVTTDPKWDGLPTQTKQDLARFFARKFVQPAVGSRSQQMKDFLQANVLGPAPAPVDPATNALAQAQDFGMEGARAFVDNDPTALIDRGLGKLAMGAADAIGKPFGVSATQALRSRGLPVPGDALIPPSTGPQNTAPKMLGSIAGSLVDPINLLAPMNVFEGAAAPAAEAGVNLLPKLAKPGALSSLLKGAAGAGATNAAIAGATSAGQQAINGQPVNLGDVGKSALMGGGLGALMGGAAGAIPPVLARIAANKADQGALARIAQMGEARPAAINPQVNDARMQNFLAARDHLQQTSDIAAARSQQQARGTLQDLANGLTLGDNASRDYLAPDSGLPTPPPLLGLAAARQSDLGGVTLAQRAAAVRDAQQAAQYQAIADSASKDYLGAEPAQPAAAMQGFAGPRMQNLGGITQAEREAAQTAQAQAGLSDGLMQRAKDLVDSQSRDYLSPEPTPDAPTVEADVEAILQRHEPTVPERSLDVPPYGDTNPHDQLKTATADESGKRFSTGTPVEFDYIRNTEGAPHPKPGAPDKFQQRIEPAGRYLSHNSAQTEKPAPGWETGTTRFKNPLVLESGDGYGEDSWKATLSRAYGGLTGKKLSQAIRQSGHDGIVTVDKYGTGEIVDLSGVAPQQKSQGAFSRLAAEEEGAFNPAAIAPATKASVRGAGDLAIGAGNVARKADSLYTGLIDRVMAKTGIKGALGKLEEWRQIAKTAPTDSPAAEGLRKAFISNYGVPPEVLDMADNAAREAHRAARPMRQQAIDLLGNLSAQHQHDLELAVTEPHLREQMISKIARESGKPRADVANTVSTIAQESGRLSGMLRDVGAVTAQGQARWDGKYLPRAYEKYFPTLSRLARRSAGLVGTKGRGIEKRVAPSSAPEMQAAGWEFRGEVGGKAVMWRDYTLHERQQMGQLFHASNAMNTLANAFERDYKNGKLLQDIARGSDTKGQFAIDASALPEGSPPPEGYTLFHNGTVPGTGIKRWGAIANHYVRDDVAHYLTWTSDNSEMLTTLRNIKKYTGVDLFKRMKTLWNPAFYVNNFMQNVPMLELAGGSVGDLPQAWREVADNGDVYRTLDELGYLKQGHLAAELGRNLQGLEVGSGTPADWARAAIRGVQNLEAHGNNLAQATDDMFKVAFVIGKMRQGMPLEEAAKLANKTFYDSSQVTAPAARIIEAMPLGSPFVKYAWYGLDKMPELILKNPAKAAALMSYFAGAKMLIDKINGTTSEQAKARDQLVPSYLQQAGGLGYMPLPMKDSHGNPLILSTANWNPLNFADNADQLNLPYWPNTLMPGGPLAAGIQALTNEDWFRQKPLRTPAGDQTAQFLWNALGPSLLADKAPGVLDALAGRESYSGLPYGVGTALANVVGLKAQPYVPMLGIKQLEQAYSKDAEGIKSQIHYLAVMKSRNPQDAAKYDAQIQQQVQALQARGQKYQQQIQAAMPALQGAK